jgi:hypothetical protein
MRLRLTGDLAVKSPRATLTVNRPDAETLRLIWHGPIPRRVSSTGLNRAAAVTFAFGLQLEDRPSQLAGAPNLTPVKVAKQRKNWYRLSWMSPDGMLVSRFNNDSLDAPNRAESDVESVGGHRIKPAPIQTGVPGLRAN